MDDRRVDEGQEGFTPSVGSGGARRTSTTARLHLFEPRWWRHFLVRAVVPSVIAFLVVAAISYAMGDRWLMYCMAVGVALALLMGSRRRQSLDGYIIKVSPTDVSGPGGPPVQIKRDWERTRRVIALDELDRARSAERPLAHRLLGRQYLYSTTGERIYLARYAFARADIHRLLTLLNLD